MPQDETEYGEFIYQYFAVPEETRLRLEAEGLAYNLGKQYTILCLPIPRSRPLRLVEEFGYFVVPKVYGLLDAGSMEAVSYTHLRITGLRNMKKSAISAAGRRARPAR